MSWLYLGIILFVVIFFFIGLKRPMHEAMFFAFLALLISSGNITHFWSYVSSAAQSYLLFTMMAFMVFGVLVEETGVITDLLDIIVAIVGKFSGGAGYVAMLSGAAIGAFCGSGPGTVAASGAFTIPAMKKTGFSAETSAMIAAAAGSLGPIIPPSAAIPVMFMMLESALPGYCSASKFWMVAWPISFWLLIQRILTLYIVIKRQRVQPIPKEERIPLRYALKKGWRMLLMLAFMILPFILDNMFADTVIARRLGADAGAQFSSFVLVTVPCVSCIFALLLWAQKGRRLSLQSVLNMISKSVSSVAPIILMTFCGFSMGSLLTDMGIAADITAQIESLSIPQWAIAVIAPLIFTFFGIFMESSSVYFLFGPVFIPIAISAGLDPMVSAMMVNVLSNGMGQISPPFALCLLISMGIAESDFGKTARQAVFWCFTQYIFVVLMLLGLLPMFGML